MTTAREALAGIFRDLAYTDPAADTEWEIADKFIKRLLSAPDSVQLELAGLLNPWRPNETAPKDGNDFQGLLFGDMQMVIFYDEPNATSPNHCWHRADGLAYHRDALKAWAPLLRAMPSEDKPK